MSSPGKVTTRKKSKVVFLVLVPMLLLLCGIATAVTLNLSNTGQRATYNASNNTFSNGFNIAAGEVVLDTVLNTAVFTVTTFGLNGSGDPDPAVIPAVGCAAGGAFCVGAIDGCPGVAQLLGDTSPVTDQNPTCQFFPARGNRPLRRELRTPDSTAGDHYPN